MISNSLSIWSNRRSAGPDYSRPSAYFWSLDNSNNIAVVGSGGPDLTVGTTIICRWWSEGTTGNDCVWSYNDTLTGWALNMSGATLALLLRNGAGGNVGYNLVSQRRDGLNAVAITRTASGALRCSVNGNAVIQLSAAPTYFTNGATATEGIGYAAGQSLPSEKNGVSEVAYIAAEASDSDLLEWSRTNYTNRFEMPGTVTDHTALVYRLRAIDWDGVSATVSAIQGSRTYSVIGAPSVEAVPSEAIYSANLLLRYITDGYVYADVEQLSPYYRIVVTTDSEHIAVTADDTGNAGGFREFGIKIDGVATQDLQAREYEWPGGERTLDVLNGLDGASRVIEVHSGIKTTSGIVSVRDIRIPGDATLAIASPAAASDRMLVVGTSISVGDAAAAPWRGGFASIMRANRGEVTIDGVGAGSLWDLAKDASTRATSVARVVTLLDGTISNTLYLCHGTNDYGLTRWSSSDFGAAYALYVDDVISAVPGIAIYCETPITRGTEAELIGGWGDLDAYRAQISTVAAARPECTLVNGPPLVTYPANYSGSVHPNTAGHIEYEANVRAIIGY